LRLFDKVALITGAGRRIGKEIAMKFSDEGAAVILNDIETALTEGVLRSLNPLEREALAIQANVGNGLEIQRMIEQICSEFGRIDIWVNNAGIKRVECGLGAVTKRFTKSKVLLEEVKLETLVFSIKRFPEGR
jgi:NAD(P)-dependent dehydrogenase (short-subunit alcohol dehydrogenase family)